MNGRSKNPYWDKHGIAFHLDGLELYDDGKHLGRVVPERRQIALYREQKAYMGTRYRTRLMLYIKIKFGWEKPEIVWF